MDGDTTYIFAVDENNNVVDINGGDIDEGHEVVFGSSVGGMRVSINFEILN